MRTGIGISKNKYFIFAVIFFIVAMFISMIGYSEFYKKRVIKSKDRELSLIAEGIPYVLGEDFFVKARFEEAFSPKENFETVKKLSKYAETQHAEYVYAIVMNNGKLYYTASSSTKDEFERGDNTPYWFALEGYNDTNTKAIINCMETMKILKMSGKDDYGEFRSVYIPKKDKNGEVYLVAADYRMSEIKKLVYYAIGFVVFNVLYFIVAISPIFIVMVKIVKKYVAELNVRAVTDELTGVANRREAFNQLGKQIELAERNGRSLTVSFIDLDGLKVINDNMGHDEGDKFIKKFTEVLQLHIRKYDIVARIGGDEFLIIFPECTLKMAKDIVERIKEEILEIKSEYIYDFSFGFSEYNIGNKMDVDKMVKIADNAMYQQKIMKKYKKNGIEFE